MIDSQGICIIGLWLAVRRSARYWESEEFPTSSGRNKIILLNNLMAARTPFRPTSSVEASLLEQLGGSPSADMPAEISQRWIPIFSLRFDFGNLIGARNYIPSVISRHVDLIRGAIMSRTLTLIIE